MPWLFTGNKMTSVFLFSCILKITLIFHDCLFIKGWPLGMGSPLNRLASHWSFDLHIDWSGYKGFFMYCSHSGNLCSVKCSKYKLHCETPHDHNLQELTNCCLSLFKIYYCKDHHFTEYWVVSCSWGYLYIMHEINAASKLHTYFTLFNYLHIFHWNIADI